MAFIRRMDRKSVAVRDGHDLKFDGEISPHPDLNNSSSALFKNRHRFKKKSAFSHYASNSRSSAYAIDDNLQFRALNPSLYQVNQK